MVTSKISTPVMPISPSASRPDLPVHRTSDLALCSMAGTSKFASLSHALIAAHGRRKRTAAAARFGPRARRLGAGELHQLRADARSACERSPRACACALAIAAIASRSPLYASANATSCRRWRFGVFAAQEAAGPLLPSPAGLPTSPAAREARDYDFLSVSASPSVHDVRALHDHGSVRV